MSSSGSSGIEKLPPEALHLINTYNANMRRASRHAGGTLPRECAKTIRKAQLQGCTMTANQSCIAATQKVNPMFCAGHYSLMRGQPWPQLASVSIEAGNRIIMDAAALNPPPAMFADAPLVWPTTIVTFRYGLTPQRHDRYREFRFRFRFNRNHQIDHATFETNDLVWVPSRDDDHYFMTLLRDMLNRTTYPWANVEISVPGIADGHDETSIEYKPSRLRSIKVERSVNLRNPSRVHMTHNQVVLQAWLHRGIGSDTTYDEEADEADL